MSTIPLMLYTITGVSWNLRMTGITIANGATCGQAEHQHTEDCPMEKVLICGYDDEISTEAPTEETTEEVTGDYTEEQQAFVDEYLQLCDDYDAAIALINSPQ